MLPTESDFADSLAALAPTKDQSSGVDAFVTAISDFTNQLQAGPTGLPGILTFGNAAFKTALLTMQPVADNSWISNFANVWEAGINTSIITPGTVTEPVWIGSGGLDVATLPSATATITTIAAAKAVLISGLASVVPTSGKPIPLATALRNATLALTFTCIGLGSPPTLTPIPIPISAE